MHKQILLADRELGYTFRQSTRARRMRLTVRADGRVTLTAPVWFSEARAEAFFLEKAGWVIGRLDFFRKFQGSVVPRRGRRDYSKHKDQALAVAVAKVGRFAEIYGYRYGKISIRNQKTCWGSCSRKGNLNFNYKLLFLPEKLQNYVIVHELCHLREMNHSKKFWALVAQAIPEHAILRKELRLSGLNFL